jgi:hypothetical protein
MQLYLEKSKVFSGIMRDIGQVFFASMFIGPLVTGSVDISLLSFGLLFSVLAWYSSVSLIRE